MASLAGLLDAMADTIRTAIDGIDFEIQVEPWLVLNPSPITVDMFPSSTPTFADSQGYGEVEPIGKFFTVRARTNTPDQDGVRDAILSLMDVEDEHSVEAALEADQTLGGLSTQVVVVDRTGLLPYPALDGLGGYVGCEWTTLVMSVPA